MSAYNGSGAFIISGTGLPFVTATTISSTVVNQLDTDLATGLSTAICKDGQTTVTANIPLAGFKLTGVGAATTANDALTYGTGTNSSTLLVPTRQILTSGSGATYTTPVGVRQLRIRLWGGGGAGAANSNNGNNGGGGGNTIFNGVNAAGGNGGLNAGSGGIGGSGGSGSASLRVPGNAGFGGINIGTGFGGSGSGGQGGPGPLGGTPSNGNNAVANTGAGGPGGSGSSFNGTTGGGGGAGEYVEYIINNPAATYTYTVGAGGTTTSAGTFGFGCNGGSGQIIVEEIY